MLDMLLMSRVKLPFVGTIHPQNNMFVMGVKLKATGDSEVIDSSGQL